MKKEERTKWFFDTPKQEFIDLLSDQIEGCFSPELKGLLLNNDFKKVSPLFICFSFFFEEKKNILIIFLFL